MPYKNKEDHKEAKRRWYLKNKKEVNKKSRERKVALIEFVRDYKKRDDVFCVDCEEERWQCLQFDHINREEKIDCVSNMARRGMPVTTLLEEIEKCEVVCANCHCIRHNGFQWEGDTNMGS
jgi:hypothetical protein